LLTIQYLGEEHSLVAAFVHARRSRQATVRDIEKYTGVNHETVTAIETRRNNPGAVNLIALCRYYNLDMATLEDV
jgi:transcriptional regulator with XRE-family HTH domain